MHTDDLDKAERRWRERSLFRHPRPRRRVATTAVVLVLLAGASLVLAQWGGLDVFALVNP